jgi:single-stranded-DNA-specific exonuclease
LERLEAVAERQLNGKELRKTLKADLEIPVEMVKDISIQDLEKLQPTGMENPDAVFVSTNVEVKFAKTVGADKKHLKFACQAGRYLLDAVAWNQADWLPLMSGRFDLLYNIEENNYMGNRTMQLKIRDMRPSN